METAERLQFPFSTTSVLCTRSFPGAREHMLHEDLPVSRYGWESTGSSDLLRFHGRCSLSLVLQL